MKVSDMSFSNEYRYYLTEEGELKNFPMLLMGKRSYCGDLEIDYRELEHTSIIIGNYCSIAIGVTFLLNLNNTHDYLGVTTYPLNVLEVKDRVLNKSPKGSIIIGNDVWIGRNVTIMPNVIVSDGAVIAANSVVTKNVEPYSIVGGNPAKLIKYRFSHELIRELLDIRWWYKDEEEILNNDDFIRGDVEAFVKDYNVDLMLVPDLAESRKSNVFFIPDFSITYSNFENVLNQFYKKYKKFDNLELLIGYRIDAELEKINALIDKIIFDKIKDSKIKIIKISGDFISFCDKSTYFITERSFETLRYVELCQKNQIPVLFGANIDIFEAL